MSTLRLMLKLGTLLCCLVSWHALATVRVPIPPLQNQGQTNFCWAFATAGMLESRFQARQGRVVELNPHALGFWGVAHHLLDFLRSAPDPDPHFESRLRHTEFEGNHLSSPSLDNDGFDLLKTHGVVPKAVWDGQFTQAIQDAIVNAVIEARAEGRVSPATVTLEDIAALMVGPGRLPSAPPSRFVWEGREMSGQQFLFEQFDYNPAKWVGVGLGKEGVGDVVRRARKALAAGYAVPMSFFFSKSPRFLRNGVMDVWEPATAIELMTTDDTFSHAVTVVDFSETGEDALQGEVFTVRDSLAESEQEASVRVTRRFLELSGELNALAAVVPVEGL